MRGGDVLFPNDFEEDLLLLEWRWRENARDSWSKQQFITDTFDMRETWQTAQK